MAERFLHIKNGKIKYVKETDYAALNIYPKKHIIMLSQTDFEFKDYVWYKYTKGKLKKVAEQDYTGYKNGKNTYKYYVNSKKTTKMNYKKYESQGKTLWIRPRRSMKKCSLTKASGSFLRSQQNIA